MILKQVLDYIKTKDIASKMEIIQHIDIGKKEIENALEHLVMIHKIEEVEPEKKHFCTGCSGANCSLYKEVFYRVV